MDKTKIENMKIGGKILGEVMSEIIRFVKPGIVELDIENKATDLIIKRGGRPSFKMVPGYKYTTCISTNDVVVHGIPKARVLKEGDVVGIDCGVFYNGYHTDMAHTVKIKNETLRLRSLRNISGQAWRESKIKSEKEIDKFLDIGKKALNEAIKQARAGNRVGHISSTIQSIVEGGGYSVVKSLVGHGVGKNLHEDPEIPGRIDSRKIEDTPLLLPGMTIAIEVIYNMGQSDVVYGKEDGWTISSADKSISGLFERTVLITERKPIILTPLG